MRLIGMFDSPFVRRVGIAMRLYGLEFRHENWSVFRDAERIRAFSPLTRVPVLVLPDGTALSESHAILDYLDGLVAPGQALFPRAEPARHRALRVATLACGAGEKAVALFYELRLHAAVSDFWVARCRAQILDTLALLESERPDTDFWAGARMGHADIALACVLRFIGEAHPGLIPADALPRLTRDAAALEALPVFREIALPFDPPA